MRRIGIGLIGSGFMGRSHTLAFRAAPAIFAPAGGAGAGNARRHRRADRRARRPVARLRPLDRATGRRWCRPGGAPRRYHHAERAAQADGARRDRGRQALSIARSRSPPPPPTPRRWSTPPQQAGVQTFVGLQLSEEPDGGVSRARDDRGRRDRRRRQLSRHPCRGLHDRPRRRPGPGGSIPRAGTASSPISAATSSPSPATSSATSSR